MLQRTGPGASSRKDLAFADLVRGPARRVSVALRTARSATPRSIPARKVSAVPRSRISISVLVRILTTVRSHLGDVGVLATAASVYRLFRASGFRATAFLVRDRLFQRSQSAVLSGLRIGLSHAGPARSLQGQITLVGTLDLPQCRKYRIIQKQEMAERLTGTRLTISSYRDVLRSLTSMQTASKLMLYRVPDGPEFKKIIAEARRLSIEVCYDIDDPVFDLDTVQENPNLHCLPRHIQRNLLHDAVLFKEAMRQCDLITVSTMGLRNLVKRSLGNVPCYVVKNGVDSETVQMGWVARNQKISDSVHEFSIALASGSLAHGADTEVAAEGVRLFLDRHPEAHVNTIGHVSKGSALRETKRLKEFRQTAYSEYLRILGQADAALVPLAPGAFNDCKSIVRLIDAAAVNVPVIASPVGEYAESQLSSSYLSAKSPEDWCDALETIASSRASAEKVSREAYQQAYEGRLLPAIWEQLDPYVKAFFSAGRNSPFSTAAFETRRHL